MYSDAHTQEDMLSSNGLDVSLSPHNSIINAFNDKWYK